MHKTRFFVGILALILPSSLVAQDNLAAAQSSDDEFPEDLVVTGIRRLPGTVQGNTSPELSVGPATIRSYAAGSLAELVEELSVQIRSDRGNGGPPIVLLNGWRISGFAEIRDLPTEAIQRIDILPEEVALKYGYSADAKVVNIVLRGKFRSLATEVADTHPTAGGNNGVDGSVGFTAIKKRNERLNIGLSFRVASALSESERSVSPGPSLYDPLGNIVAANGSPSGEIDPALSALVGRVVTVAGVPTQAQAGPLPLTAFVATADKPNIANASQFRSLVPATRSGTVNLSYAAPLSRAVSASINARLEANDTRRDLGLPQIFLTVPVGNPFSPFTQSVGVQRLLANGGPLAQRTSAQRLHLGGSLQGQIGKWRWTAVTNLDRSLNTSHTERNVNLASVQTRLDANDATLNPFGDLSHAGIGIGAIDSGRLLSKSGNLEAVFNGPLVTLPAGAAFVAINVAAATASYGSSLRRVEDRFETHVSRNTVGARVNLDLPIADKAKNVLSFLGTLSANANASVDHHSDFGTLTSVGYGASWSPIRQARFTLSETTEDVAPDIATLGGTSLITPNVTIFDFRAGRIASVATIAGGNADLRATHRHTLKIGAVVRPIGKSNLTLTATYIESRTRNAVQDLSEATDIVERAFPGRFVRDAQGSLVSVDLRPINLASTHRSEVRWGGDFSLALASKLLTQFRQFKNGTGANPIAGLQIPSAFGNENLLSSLAGAGLGRGRFQVALYHTIHLKNALQVDPGGPLTDLLDGGAIDGNGGQPRHELEGQLGYANNGLGIRLSANWQSPTRVLLGTAAQPQSIDVNAATKVNFRFFVDFGQNINLIRKAPFLIGSRLAISVDNLFDTRRQISSANAAIVQRYDPQRVDPLGRTVKVTFRKVFF